MLCSACAQSGSSDNNTSSPDNTVINIASMKGPTSIGLVKLYSDSDNKLTTLKYNQQIYGTAAEISTGLIKGDIDIAAVPANQAAILYHKTNFSENPSLDTTAAYIHFNSDYFEEKKKKHIGKTYYRYLTELKLEQAKKLILETDMSLSVICFKCGFGNQSNFLRQFKRSYGCTPTQMRQRKFN